MKWKVEDWDADEEACRSQLILSKTADRVFAMDRDIWKNNKLQIIKFYGFIGKYFVDREAET